MNQSKLLVEIITVLQGGGTILYPTDTVWGIGCDVMNEKAYERIYEIKERKRDLPFILLVDSIPMLKKYIKNIHPRVETLLTLHNQPLTIIYEASDLLPEYALSDKKTIAIRIVKDSLCQLIIKKLGHPIVSSSANISGQELPLLKENIDNRIIARVDYDVALVPSTENSVSASVLAYFDYDGILHFLR